MIHKTDQHKSEIFLVLPYSAYKRTALQWNSWHTGAVLYLWKLQLESLYVGDLLYYPSQPADSLQSFSNYQWYFLQKWAIIFFKLHRDIKDAE